MSVLLDLNDALGALREDLGAAKDLQENTDHPEQPASRRQVVDCLLLRLVPATQAVREAVQDNGSQSRGRDSISNSYLAPSGFRKDFRINGHVGESISKDTLSFSSLEHQI